MAYRLFQSLQLDGTIAALSWPGKYASVITPVVIDLNGDKQLDFAFHLWQGQGEQNWGGVTNAPSLNKLVIYESQKDGTYRESITSLTSDVASNVSLPGISRKVSVADINQDGKLDWVYALNREDGRSGSVVEYNIAKAAAVISQPDGKYRIVEFGDANWYHSVYIDQNLYGTPLVVLAGYYRGPSFGGLTEGFVLGGGLGYSWSAEANSFGPGSALPTHPNTFLSLVSPSGNPQFVTVMNSLDGIQLLGLFEKRGADWVSVDSLTPYKSVMVNFESYSFDRGQAELFEMGDGTYASAGGYSESRNIALHPGDESTSVFKFSAAQIDAPRADGYYYQNDGVAVQRFDFYRSSGETLNKLNIKIINEDTQLNSNFFDVLDFNGDGLEDIAVYPYVSGGQPRVYLNTGGNVFYKLNNDLFPVAPIEWGSSASSKFVDINSDGVLDLFYAPMNGFSLSESEQLKWLTYLGDQTFDSAIISTDITVSDRLGSNKILTWSGNDIVDDSGASSERTTIDLGGGIDQVRYSGPISNYSVSATGLTFQVLERNSALSDSLLNVERVSFSDTNIAIDIDGAAGQIYRLYKAAFGRVASPEALGYWLYRLDDGLSLGNGVERLIGSAEFLDSYGHGLNNQGFITFVCNNALNRNPLAPELADWQSRLSSGLTRAQFLLEVSESIESKAVVEAQIENGIEYIPYVYQPVYFSGSNGLFAAEIYNGAVNFLDYQAFGSQAGDIVTGSDANDFINLLGGDDAADGGAGRDVLDGGTGSNFLTGGTGADIFFLDGRGGETTWSTITDFNPEDSVNIWGWQQGTSKLILALDGQGAEGFTGATFHYDLSGNGLIDSSITFSNIVLASLPDPIAQEVAGNGYLLFS